MDFSAQETRVRDFYTEIAPRYDSEMSSSPENQIIRDCFWGLAARHLPRPARLLDFGCGTGIDAAHFARAGHSVLAYDIAPGMVRVMESRCGAEIAAGAVRVVSGSLDELQELVQQAPPLDAVVCNFAVLNLIPRPAPLLRWFGRVVRPGGRLLLSLQNPWTPGDMRSLAFWRGLLAWPRTGAVVYRSKETGLTYKHTVGSIRRAARPEFRLVEEHSMDAGPGRQAPVGRRGLFRLLAFARG